MEGPRRHDDALLTNIETAGQFPCGTIPILSTPHLPFACRQGTCESQDRAAASCSRAADRAGVSCSRPSTANAELETEPQRRTEVLPPRRVPTDVVIAPASLLLVPRRVRRLS